MEQVLSERGLQMADDVLQGLGKSYEAYRTNMNWPCKRLLEAMSARAPEDRGVKDAVQSVNELAHDFARFQEVFIQYNAL